MTETKRTNRFALLFFLYFLAYSVAIAMVSAVKTESNSIHLLLAQPFCFLPPLVFYFLYTKKDVKQTLRLNPLGWKNILIVFFLAIAIQPVMGLLSYLMAQFFPNPIEESASEIQQSGLLLSMLSMAILPALLEETLARGVLLSGYQFLGKWKAAFACALLFGLLHMNPQQFPYAFMAGFLFCFLVERTDSLFASILPHMIINGTAVISILMESAETVAVEPEQSATLLTLLLMVLLSLPWLALFLFLFLKLNPPKAELPLMDENGNPYRERFLTPSILLIFLLYGIFGLFPYLFLS